jgi:hypothetical protein
MVVGSIKGWVEAICEAFDCTFRVSRPGSGDAGGDGGRRTDGLTSKLVEFGLAAKKGGEQEEYGGGDGEGEEDGEEGGEGGGDNEDADAEEDTVDFDATVDDMTPEQREAFGIFESVVQDVFKQWTILKLATKMTWGGTWPGGGGGGRKTPKQQVERKGVGRHISLSIRVCM